MLKKISLILILVSILSAETSVFSTAGVGDLYMSKGSYCGMAQSDTLTANPVNYAGWAGISNAYFNLSFDYVNHDITGNNGQASSYDDLAISGFSFVLPFANKHFFGVNLSPVSLANIQKTTPTVSLPTTQEPAEELETHSLEKRIGSFNNFSLIYGKAFRNFSFATDVSFIFGGINESVLTVIENVSTGSLASFNTAIIENNYQTNAFVINPGLSAVYRNGEYGFAGKISVPVYNRFEENNSLLKSNANVDGKVIEEKTIAGAKWPISLGIGASWEPERWQLSSDFFYTAFDGADLGLRDGGNYADYWKLSASAKYHHSDRLLSAYYQKMSYRAGASIEQRPVRSNSSVINDYTVFSSITTPFPGNRASVETNFSYTISGDQANNGYEDKSWRVGLTFHNSNSWWLRKTRYDD